MDLGIYENAIDYAFNHSDIKNVAISGAYSSGKSSVIASYEKKHDKLKFLHISLAHFAPSDQANNTLKNRESILEGKILNQLIHQIDSKKIPQTSFRIKRKIQTNDIIKRTFSLVALFISFCYIYLGKYWKRYIHLLPNTRFKNILSISISPYASLVSGCIIIAILTYFLYKLIKAQKYKNILYKLNLKGNEIEIFNDCNESFFDKYLNDVLYLFENSGADAIVFEDMDRFDANSVFEHLREVNMLANIQMEKSGKPPIRFFYLLRDDVFESKDRTKFFDYIIPIVPVVDSSNSYDQFIAIFEKSQLLEKFDENFLQGLSLYIDDMRILKNIYNEFLIYYSLLNITDLNCNKMLAIITYKNIFPRDFANLQLNRGFVYTLFRNKDSFAFEEIEKLNKIIAIKKEKIQMLNDKLLETIEEWDVLFAHRNLGDTKWYLYSENELTNYIVENLYGEEKNNFLHKREELIKLLKTDISKEEDEISILENEATEARDKPLSGIITRENIDTIFSVTTTNGIGLKSNYNDVKGSIYFDLLKYLIRNSYIDETYADYMTYFYENSLQRSDKIFLRSITDKIPKEYTYKLANPKLVVARLSKVDFDQEEILNFDLLACLLKSMSNKEYLDRFINQIKNTINFKFISAALDSMPEVHIFVEYLNTQWPETFRIALSEKN